MEPVESKDEPPQLSAWRLTPLQQQAARVEQEERAKASATAALHAQQQASFLALIGGAQATAAPSPPISVSSPFNTTIATLPPGRQAMQVNNAMPAALPMNPYLYFAQGNTFPSPNSSTMLVPPPSIPSAASDFTPPPTLPIRRGMNAVEVSSESVTTNGTGTAACIPPTRKPAALAAPTRLPCHKRIHSRGMEPLSTEFARVSSSSSSTVSASPSVASIDSQTTKVAPPQSLVHQACRLYSQMDSIVKSALQVDPNGVKRRLSSCRALVDKTKKRKRELDSYDFPINIALDHCASRSVIQILAQAGPSVLVEPDGPEECCTLSIALVNKRDLDTMSLLFKANPDQVQVCDRHENYPLHAACVNGSSLAIVKLLTAAYPSALLKTNFHGQTPLDIAQRNTSVTDSVIDYLQQTSFGRLEEDAIHLDGDCYAVKVKESCDDVKVKESCKAAA